MADRKGVRRFRFALAKLHRLRAQQERLARRSLAAALQEHGSLENSLAQVRADLEACIAERETSASGLAQAVEVGLRRTELSLIGHCKTAQQKVDLARELYFARRRDMRATERLHDLRREEWRAEWLKEEQMEIEEMNRARASVGGGLGR